MAECARYNNLARDPTKHHVHKLRTLSARLSSSNQLCTKTPRDVTSESNPTIEHLKRAITFNLRLPLVGFSRSVHAVNGLTDDAPSSRENLLVTQRRPGCH
jgi:hypothetical protein